MELTNKPGEDNNETRTPDTPTLDKKKPSPYRVICEHVVQRLDEEEAGETHIWDIPEVQIIMEKHLHVTKILNPTLAAMKPGLEWHSTHSNDKAMGADTRRPEVFMTNSHTWINIEDDEGKAWENLRAARQAMELSTGRARVVMAVWQEHARTMMRHKWDRGKGPGIHMQQIATIDKNTITQTQTTVTTQTKHTNDTTIAIILIETKHAPAINIRKIERDMRALQNKRKESRIQMHPPKWICTQDKYRDGELPETTKRSASNEHPGLTWYRHMPIYSEGRYETPMAAETIANLMGLTPGPIKRQLKKAGYHESVLTPQNIGKIRARLRGATHELYARRERWRRKKKHGVG